MSEHKNLLIRLCPMHEGRIAEELNGVDIEEFFDFVQQRKYASETTNKENHIRFKDDPHWLAWLDTSQFIADCEKIQRVLVKMMESTPKGEFSIAEFANALHIKGIRISSKGVGIDDGINYIEKFGLTPGRALYNRWNAITSDRRDTSKLKHSAETIIKKYKL